jgi:hypothetical protein
VLPIRPEVRHIIVVLGSVVCVDDQFVLSHRTVLQRKRKVFAASVSFLCGKNQVTFPDEPLEVAVQNNAIASCHCRHIAHTPVTGLLDSVNDGALHDRRETCPVSGKFNHTYSEMPYDFSESGLLKVDFSKPRASINWSCKYCDAPKPPTRKTFCMSSSVPTRSI